MPKTAASPNCADNASLVTDMNDEENLGHECASCGDWTFEEGELCTLCMAAEAPADSEPCGCVPTTGGAA